MEVLSGITMITGKHPQSKRPQHNRKEITARNFFMPKRSFLFYYSKSTEALQPHTQIPVSAIKGLLQNERFAAAPFQPVVPTEKRKSSVHNGQIRYEHSICLWATKKIFLPFLRMNSNSHNSATSINQIICIPFLGNGLLQPF